jgi:hypothetical protein
VEEIRNGFEVRVAVDPRSPHGLPAQANTTGRKVIPVINPFTIIPDELKVRIFRYLDDRELIVASGVSVVEPVISLAANERLRYVKSGTNYVLMDSSGRHLI